MPHSVVGQRGAEELRGVCGIHFKEEKRTFCGWTVTEKWGGRNGEGDGKERSGAEVVGEEVAPDRGKGHAAWWRTREDRRNHGTAILPTQQGEREAVDMLKASRPHDRIQ